MLYTVNIYIYMYIYKGILFDVINKSDVIRDRKLGA